MFFKRDGIFSLMVAISFQGADIIGVNCKFDPTTSLRTLVMMREALDREGLNCHLMIQPVGYHTPDAARTGFSSLPELPFGKMGRKNCLFVFLHRQLTCAVTLSNFTANIFSEILMRKKSKRSASVYLFVVVVRFCNFFQRLCGVTRPYISNFKITSSSPAFVSDLILIFGHSRIVMPSLHCWSVFN